MKLAPDELAAIAARTLEHYEQRAESFWEGTRDHDVSQNIATLLKHIEGEPPLAILDLGCGPGRDLKTLRALGHAPVGLEGSARFAAMAREYSGCEVWEQDFLQPRPAGPPFRRRLRQCRAVSRADAGIAARASGDSCDAQASRRIVQLESARRRQRGMEPRPLRRLSSPSKPGATILPAPAWSRSSTITVPPACRASSNPGSPPLPARRERAHRAR